MNVLLIGDSIRIFYQDSVKEKLGDNYTVYAPKENCRFSSYVLNSLRYWLAEFPSPDIIHFNAGLWDAAILYGEDGCFTPLDEYIAAMKKICRVLKSTGATLIFATSTPVSEKKAHLPGPVPPAHSNTDIALYNAAAVETLRDENIYINDLFSLMYENKEKYLCDDMIHPSEEGIDLLATAVAEAIKRCPVRETSSAAREKTYQGDFCEKTMQ